MLRETPSQQFEKKFEPTIRLAALQSNIKENLPKSTDTQQLNQEISVLSQHELRDQNWNLPKNNQEQIMAKIKILEGKNQEIMAKQGKSFSLDLEKKYDLNDAVKLRALSLLPDQAINKLGTEFLTAKKRKNFQKQEEIIQNLALLMQIWRNQINKIESQKDKNSPQDIKKKVKLEKALIDAQEIIRLGTS
jgi:hypothetical protein